MSTHDAENIFKWFFQKLFFPNNCISDHKKRISRWFWLCIGLSSSQIATYKKTKGFKDIFGYGATNIVNLIQLWLRHMSVITLKYQSLLKKMFFFLICMFLLVYCYICFTTIASCKCIYSMFKTLWRLAHRTPY